MESSNQVRKKLMNTPTEVAELRRNAAEFRRAQIDQVRAIVRAQLFQCQEQRQQLSKTRVRAHAQWSTLQLRIRAKLKEISAQAGKIGRAYKNRTDAAAVSAGNSSPAGDQQLLARSAGTGSS